MSTLSLINVITFGLKSNTFLIVFFQSQRSISCLTVFLNKVYASLNAKTRCDASTEVISVFIKIVNTENPI